MATRRLGGIATSSSVPDNGGDNSGGGGGGSAGGYVDDVFSTYVYVGDQSNSSRDIVNGVDLDSHDGMVWIKIRSRDKSHYLFDNERGLGKYLSCNENSAESTYSNGNLTAFNSDGFTIGDSHTINETGEDVVSWTFRKAPSFFDIVTYTGDGSGNRTLSHNLGSVPGMYIAKRTDNTDNWNVFHMTEGLYNSSGDPIAMYLNNDQASTSYGTPNPSSWPSTDTTLEIPSARNSSNEEYVVYVFAHDDSDEGLIKCGSYTGNGNADGPEVDLGWEPQYVLIKCSSHSRNWVLLDSARGIVSDGEDMYLTPNASDLEYSNPYINPLSHGFKLANVSAAVNANGREYIYMAIRRSNKPAEEFEPEELFAIENADGTVLPQFKTGWPVDFALQRSVQSDFTQATARLTQKMQLKTNESEAESSSTSSTFDYSNGWRDASGVSADLLSWMWRRAPGFFDVVAYEGTSGGARDKPHSLAAVPEMMWVKNRTDSLSWVCYHKDVGATKFLALNSADSATEASYAWENTAPTNQTFHVSSDSYVNAIGKNYIAYLFASVPGICDIGSYTGTSGDLDIDCGFTNGARFVLIKRTDAAGDWMYFDTLRGISASDSPMLTLNTTAAEASGSYIKPISSGFTVTSNLTGISGAEYIYMAIA